MKRQKILFPSLSFVLSFFSGMFSNAQASTVDWSKLTADCEKLNNWKRCETLIQNTAPGLLEGLKKMPRGSELLLWGSSRNRDKSKLDQDTVSPLIMNGLLTLAGQPKLSSQHTGHAGIIHTYGYLFSNLKTPFGYKRDRWIQGEIEEGFGLPNGILGPTPSEGNFLSNITALLIPMAVPIFQGQNHIQVRSKAPQAIRQMKIQNLKGARITEKVQTGSSSLVVMTHFYRFPNILNPKGNVALLTYSLHFTEDQFPLIITAFPIDESMIKRLLLKPNGHNVEITLDYNAIHSAWGDPLKSKTGSREIHEF